MNDFLDKIKLYWKYVLGFIFILIILLFWLIYRSQNTIYEDNIVSNEIVENISDNNILVTGQEDNINTIFVDIKGAVKTPGVYKLNENSRVIDAIDKAGGLNKSADTSTINLSKKLEDGNVIIIYTKDKIEEIKKQEVVIEYIEKECSCPDVDNSACIKDDDIVIEKDVEKTDESEIDNSNNKVSLNSATKEQLMTIKGIGESKAEDIINYRQENGEFKSIEDIKNVKGIGDALFDKIKEYITL